MNRSRGFIALHRARGDLGGPGFDRNALEIQDEDDGAVAEDRRARIEFQVTQDGRDRLHHDLLGVEDPVNDDAEGERPHTRDDDAGFARGRLRGF